MPDDGFITDGAGGRSQAPSLDPRKFRDAQITAAGETRAWVEPQGLHTVWFNTGTLCNLTCLGCYIESSPTNDRLVYLSADEVRAYLDEIREERLGTVEIGFTGGEPFMNPGIVEMLDLCLERGFDVLVLTNAMKPMHHKKAALLDLRARYGLRLDIRVSLDHYTRARHEELRGPGSWQPAVDGLAWLSANGFAPAVAGRRCWGEDESVARAEYGKLFRDLGLAIDANDPVKLVLFPEMDERRDVPEITTACWNILGVQPQAMMCATSRMVIKRKGAVAPSVVACTLLPYDPRFELGTRLSESLRPVPLNHPHCARFCVLGGGSCSAA